VLTYQRENFCEPVALYPARSESRHWNQPCRSAFKHRACRPNPRRRSAKPLFGR